MKFIDLLCKASVAFGKLDTACDRLSAFANEVFPASQPVLEYLDEHDRLQRIAENMDKQCREQAHELATAMRQPINIQIQIEKEK